VDDLDDLFQEMDTVIDEFQPPLTQWQTKLEGLFTNIWQGNEGAEEVRRSYTMMLTLKAVDWRQHNTAKFDNRPKSNDDYIMHCSHFVEWVSSAQLEPWSSSEPASLVSSVFIPLVSSWLRQYT
jgi:hypothetical protein